MLNAFSKFYGKVGVIFWFLFHLIWKNYVLYWDFDLKSWIVDFFTRFTQEKTPQNKFSSQNIKVKNNYFFFSAWNENSTIIKESCFVVFFHEWNEWKNPQFNFSSQDLSIERNFFKWDGKVTKISHLLFHGICKIHFRQVSFLISLFWK